MRKIECKICKEQFKENWLLKKHITQKHKETTVAQYIVNTEYNGNWPLCNCGCNKKLIYYPGKIGFSKYLHGHHSSIKNNFNTEKSKRNSAKTRKKRFKEGKIKIWNSGVKKGDGSEYGKVIEKYSQLYTKENNPKRAEKISKKLKGKKHTKEHTENHRQAVLKAWTPEMRHKQRNVRMDYLINNHKQYRSKLEDYFEKDFLKKLKIEYERDFYVKEIKTFYDFHILNTNILIETDGDFWHCNPNSNFNVPKYKCQIQNLKRDIEKNIWAKKNNYKLLRFWESDIKSDRLGVIQRLITEIKSI